MNKVRVEDAVGMVLAHDLTKIVPGEFKGPAFKKGYIIKSEDVATLKDIGKNHINVLELPEGTVHENDAAGRISKAITGSGVFFSGPSEGKIELKAERRGLVKINAEALNRVNDIEDVVVATIHTNTMVNEGQSIAATRIIPLVIDAGRIMEVEKIGESYQNNIISVRELKSLKAGIVIIGTEVYEGRIMDRFGAVMEAKLNHYGCTCHSKTYVPDELSMIEEAMKTMIFDGAEIILACGGMSVDADDVTPNAIRNISDRVVSYGIPAMPGNMVMLAYRGNIPIFGIPGAAIYLKNISFDFLFPRILAGDMLTKKDVVSYGHGGLCLGCRVCVFPRCPFGK